MADGPTEGLKSKVACGAVYYVWVFPIPVAITIFSLLIYALVAIATGAASGKLASAVLGVPASGLLEDGFLGLLGFLLFGLAVVFVPSLAEFLNYRFGNSPHMSLLAAPVLPCFRELSRFIRYRITSAALSRRLQHLRRQGH